MFKLLLFWIAKTLSLDLTWDVGIRATLFRRWIISLGKFFNRKLLSRLDEMLSRVFHLALFPPNGRDCK